MHYLGIDVAKTRLDLGDAGGGLSQPFANKRTGVNKLIGLLETRYAPGDVQLVIEPTSTYHHLLIHALAEQHIAYTLVNPASTAYYARVQMKRAKTDRVDTQTLARLGESEQFEPTPPPEDWRERLKFLMRHRDELLKDALAWSNRLHAASRSPWTTREELQSIRRMVDHLKREKKSVDDQVKALAGNQPGLMKQVRLLTTIKGIGEQTALLISIELPPVERCRSAKVWTAFCGVAPGIRQSGQRSHSFLSRMGSARMRRALYMPALAAMRSNPALKSFAERLKARGKAGLTIVSAVMNKLLRISFGVTRSGKPFDPAYYGQAVHTGMARTDEPRDRTFTIGSPRPASPVGGGTHRRPEQSGGPPVPQGKEGCVRRQHPRLTGVPMST